MPCYVDPAIHLYRGQKYCHLFADSLRELYEIGERIGMRRSWFQSPPKASWPHYDLNPRKRALAVVEGAFEVESHQTVLGAAHSCVEWYQALGEDKLVAFHRERFAKWFEAFEWKMFTVGKRPFYECSSRGDKRFSAFYAHVNGKSIEEQYQAAKVFPGGVTGLSWREAKSKTPINGPEVVALYESLWRKYLAENPSLYKVLSDKTGLSDTFGFPDGLCQAAVLWKLRNEYLAEDL